MIRPTINPHLDRQSGEWTDLLRQLRGLGDVLKDAPIGILSGVAFAVVCMFLVIGCVLAIGGGQ